MKTVTVIRSHWNYMGFLVGAMILFTMPLTLQAAASQPTSQPLSYHYCYYTRMYHCMYVGSLLNNTAKT